MNRIPTVHDAIFYIYTDSTKFFLPAVLSANETEYVFEIVGYFINKINICRLVIDICIFWIIANVVILLISPKGETKPIAAVCHKQKQVILKSQNIFISRIQRTGCKVHILFSNALIECLLLKSVL